jgi:hypothetical protein
MSASPGLHLGEGALDRFEPPHPTVVGRVVDDLGVAPVVGVAGAEDEVVRRSASSRASSRLVGRGASSSVTRPV